MKFQSNAIFNGTITANSVANAGTNTDKFLVLDASGNVDFRTALELYNDLGIGSLPAGFTSTVKHAVKAGVALTKGQAVYVTSADGTNMIVGKASNASEATSSKTMGLIESNLSQNGQGVVITEGLLAGLNTTGATNAGDPVWLGTDGNLIYGLTNKPYAPAHLVFIGIVTRINANNGEIFVKVQNGFELNEIHDIDLKTTTPVNGHILGYNGTLWVNKTIAGWLGYTPADAANIPTRTETVFTATANQSVFTVNYTVGSVEVFYNGSKMAPAEFTATNGTSITLASGIPEGTILTVVANGIGGGASKASFSATAPMAYDSNTGVFSMPAATGSQNGYLTSANWTTFNNKQNALTLTVTGSSGAATLTGATLNIPTYTLAGLGGQPALNGTGFVKISGTTISYDNSTYYLASNPNGYITSSASSLSLTGNLTVSSGNSTGGGIILADDGDIVDLNDGFCAMRFSSGVRIHSGNRSGGAVIKLGSGGDIIASSDITAYGSPSDIRFKENVKPLENALDRVLKLQGVTFDWKEDSETRMYINLKEDIGFIAQQVQEVVPELVRQNDNGYLSLRDRGMTALLVESIKELKKENDELRDILKRNNLI
jgi:hypothetical protein